MHMADALISPAIGGMMWAGSAFTAAYAARKLRVDPDDKKIPLMGVMGAFVFTAQMINFTIPGTGSSGHIGGGMLLAVLLGPYAGFLTMASVLLIQALFFADGGLLAFGCNLFNMGFYTCFIAYPLIFKVIAKKKSKVRLAIASILSVTAALQLGSFSVVLETFLSGKTELPFKTFLLFMQPIHLVIGLVEGFITAAAVLFLREARPDLIPDESETGKKTWSYKKVIIVVTVAALIIGGIASWFSSNNPDGLEWSIEKVIGSAELRSGGNENKPLEELQKKITVLPDYQFKTDGESKSPQARKAGTSVSGLAGSAMTLALVAVIAFCTAFFKKKKGSA